jgi:hypothetical protein
MDYDASEEISDQRSCELAGCCDACGGECQGKAWPDGVGYNQEGERIYWREH